MRGWSIEPWRIGWYVRRGCVVLLVPLLGAACGGGGGSDAPPDDLTQGEFSGTAAIGSPVANGTLELRCTSGTRTASTGPDGRYRVELEKALQLPCVMLVRDGTVGGQPNRESMAGVLLRLGGVANVTPWTHLIAARLLGGEPNNAVRTLPASELARLLADDKVAAARAFVREQLAKVLGNSPSADIDPIGTAFEAVPGNGMDDLVSAIHRGLADGGKSLGLAAQEIALNGLEMYFVPKSCRAGVLTGFTGSFNDVLVQTPYRPPPSGALGGTESYGGTAEGDSGGGGEGAGVGGSLGQFLRTKVEVRRADGSLLGTATTDNDKGMVTLVTCDYRGPLRITLRGERDDAAYYDESRKLNVSFSGRSMCAVLPGRTKNVGVTPLTNAACAYLDELVKSRAATPERAPWADEALIEQANAAALKAYNDHAGPNFRLDDITRLPVVIGSSLDQQQDVLGFNQNGIYAAVLAGLVQSAGRYDPDAPSPALAFTDQIARDLTDGTLDHSTAAGGSAFAGGTPSYLVDQMPMQTFSDTSGNALRLGDAALRSTGTAVVKSIFMPNWHRDNHRDPFYPVQYSATATLRGDGVVVVKIVRNAVTGYAPRVDYPDLVTPAGVRVVDFRFIPPTDALRVTSTPANVIAFSDKGEVYTLSGLDFAWTPTTGAQGKVVDVTAAPRHQGYAEYIRLTSDGRVSGEEVETKLPSGVRFEAIGELGGSSFHLIDADRTLSAFIGGGDRYDPAGRNGRFAAMTPFRGLRAKMVGGSGNIFPGSTEEGTLVVLEMRGQVWIGPASVLESNAGTARRIDGLEDTCYVHRWYVVRCDGSVYSLHDTTLPPFKIATPLFPGLSQTWRVFNGEQSTGDEVTRAISYTGCSYEIRYSAAAGWMVTPDTASRTRSECVSPQWNGDPVVFVR
ncbi:MAG: hypothetical protein HZC37_04840 [Burkholderiales bacterium]|nr:hypothetical protein [Burkholderiales bacterium]